MNNEKIEKIQENKNILVRNNSNNINKQTKANDDKTISNININQENKNNEDIKKENNIKIKKEEEIKIEKNEN